MVLIAGFWGFEAGVGSRCLRPEIGTFSNAAGYLGDEVPDPDGMMEVLDGVSPYYRDAT